MQKLIDNILPSNLIYMLHKKKNQNNTLKNTNTLKAISNAKKPKSYKNTTSEKILKFYILNKNLW